jgi:hypothetical protein
LRRLLPQFPYFPSTLNANSTLTGMPPTPAAKLAPDIT